MSNCWNFLVHRGLNYMEFKVPLAFWIGSTSERPVWHNSFFHPKGQNWRKWRKSVDHHVPGFAWPYQNVTLKNQGERTPKNCGTVRCVYEGVRCIIVPGRSASGQHCHSFLFFVFSFTIDIFSKILVFCKLFSVLIFKGLQLSNKSIKKTVATFLRWNWIIEIMQ